MNDYSNASNAMVATVGFYADALAVVTEGRDAALAVRDIIAKDLRVTQERMNELDHVVKVAQEYIDTQQLIAGTPLAKLYDALSRLNAKR